ncbi:MAG: hypothetical protein QOD30_986 [Actinomycetota bacterium]|jgi:hypothetical protein|nr:hypothetical protein [Actinomycetota bacterium]
MARRRVSLRKAHRIAAERMGRIDPVERWLRALWIWIVGHVDESANNHR